jgi:hypothetical protein
MSKVSMSKGWLIEELKDAKREADAYPELRERVFSHSSGFLPEQADKDLQSIFEVIQYEESSTIEPKYLVPGHFSKNDTLLIWWVYFE